MLKELLRERLIAAAEEIFGIFEKTLASYEEQLCRAREESERHRRQLEAVCKSQVVVSLEDVEPLICRQKELAPQPQRWSYSLKQELPQPPKLKEEEDAADIGKVQLTGVCAESKEYADKPPESSHLNRQSGSGDRCGGPPPGDLIVPLSDSDDAEEPSRSKMDDLKGDKKQLKCSEKTTHNGRKQAWRTPVTCSICGKRFAKNNQIRHMKIHTGEKPFCCSTCGKAFTLKRNMEIHMRTHTGEKPFTCSTCGKGFPQKASMLQHLRTHTGEKPFTCSVCGRGFAIKGNMLMHVKNHAQVKPFGCSFCSKTYCLNSQLVAHMRTHTGERPFCCSTCGRTFTQRMIMIRHMRTHARKNF